MTTVELGQSVAVPDLACPECGKGLVIEVVEADEDGVPTESCLVMCEAWHEAILAGTLGEDLEDHRSEQHVWQPVIDRALGWARKSVRATWEESE